MSKEGLAATPQGTTSAPTMYQEVEQSENVARGHLEVIEIIAYDSTKEPKRHPFEKGETQGRINKDSDGNTMYVERSRGPYFCQDSEQALIFSENNPDTRTETFTVQVRESTAVKYLDAPANMKQFERKVQHG